MGQLRGYEDHIVDKFHQITTHLNLDFFQDISESSEVSSDYSVSSLKEEDFKNTGNLFEQYSGDMDASTASLLYQTDRSSRTISDPKLAPAISITSAGTFARSGSGTNTPPIHMKYSRSEKSRSPSTTTTTEICLGSPSSDSDSGSFFGDNDDNCSDTSSEGGPPRPEGMSPSPSPEVSPSTSPSTMPRDLQEARSPRGNGGLLKSFMRKKEKRDDRESQPNSPKEEKDTISPKGSKDAHSTKEPNSPKVREPNSPKEVKDVSPKGVKDLSPKDRDTSPSAASGKIGIKRGRKASSTERRN